MIAKKPTIVKTDAQKQKEFLNKKAGGRRSYASDITYAKVWLSVDETIRERCELAARDMGITLTAFFVVAATDKLRQLGR